MFTQKEMQGSSMAMVLPTNKVNPKKFGQERDSPHIEQRRNYQNNLSSPFFIFVFLWFPLQVNVLLSFEYVVTTKE